MGHHVWFHMRAFCSQHGRRFHLKISPGGEEMSLGSMVPGTQTY